MFKFKNDGYKSSRERYSRWVTLSCDKCKEKLLLYQKDGPGPLKRLYLDRIFSPKKLVKLINTNKSNLFCPKCKFLIGTRYTYEKENRPAFRLYVGAVSKKITKGIF